MAFASLEGAFAFLFAGIEVLDFDTGVLIARNQKEGYHSSFI